MCCVLSNKRLLKLINHQSGDEILRQFQILFIALTFFFIIIIKHPLVVLCYKMNKTFFFFYQTSLCHTLFSKHLGCLKMPDTGSSTSKPLLRKEKRITLSFKIYLSVDPGVTAQIFFSHFAIYWTRRIARAGQIQGWCRPAFRNWQQTAPAASKEGTRSFTASGNLKISLLRNFLLTSTSGKFIYAWRQKGLQIFLFCFFLFFFSPHHSSGFATIILAILDTHMKSWTFLIPMKVLALMICQNFHRQTEIAVKHCVLVPVQNWSPSSLGKSIVFWQSVLSVLGWLQALGHSSLLFACCFPFLFLPPWAASTSGQVCLLYVAFTAFGLLWMLAICQRKTYINF